MLPGFWQSVDEERYGIEGESGPAATGRRTGHRIGSGGLGRLRQREQHHQHDRATVRRRLERRIEQRIERRLE
jgi:hypothetical protein